MTEQDGATVLWNVLQEGSNKGFITGSDAVTVLMNSMETKPIFSVLKEKVITDYCGFSMPTNAFMFESINRKVVQFVESGLAEELMKKYQWKNILHEEGGPKVLTFEHLHAGFSVWLASCAIAVLVFLCEKCWRKN